MAQLEIENMSAYLRKMAINGYEEKPDLPEHHEPVSYTHLDVYKRQRIQL